MFSGARGSGRLVGSRPGPWSAMRMMRSSSVVSKEAVIGLGAVVGVAVDDGVDGGFADGHGDVGDGVLVETGALGVLLGGPFDLVYAFERGVEREAETACSRFSQGDL